MQRQIKSYEEYITIVDKYRRNCDYSNVYFLKQQINELINKNKLSFVETGESLYLFEKCEGFSRFYYYACKGRDTKELTSEEPLVVEFIYNKALNENQREAVQHLKRLGFTLGRRSIRMTLQDIEDFNYKDLLHRQEIPEIRYANSNEENDIYELLTQSFEPQYAFIPTIDELRQIIRNNRIIVAVHNETIIGLEHFEIKNRVLKCWHIVVTQEHQGKGVGWQLFSESHRRAIGKAESGQIWLREDNIPALTMYHSGGYERDGRRSNEYIFQNI